MAGGMPPRGVWGGVPPGQHRAIRADQEVREIAVDNIDLLRLAPGISVQALMQNDGEQPDLAQGTPVHCFLPPDALRVLAGSPREVPVPADEPLVAS